MEKRIKQGGESRAFVCFVFFFKLNQIGFYTLPCGKTKCFKKENMEIRVDPSVVFRHIPHQSEISNEYTKR